MWFYLAIAAAILALAVSHGPQRTPPGPTLDKSQFIENCMTYGSERVGDCMNYLSWEA